MDGIVIVDKPAGLTSADVVRIAKRRLGVKAGHLGTLDPFATGVLPLCVGEGTRIAQFLLAADKCYIGRIRLGSETDTADRTGRVIREADVPVLQPDDLEKLAHRLLGEQSQTPPMYSAIKSGGVPLYKLARAGKEIDRTPRPISIYRLKLQAAAAQVIEFDLHCSKGTYVRVLAQDIGVALGSAAHLESLRRTAFGNFTLEGATTVAALEKGEHINVIGLRSALAHLREIAIDRQLVSRARRGQQTLLRELPAAGVDEAAKLIGPDGELVAVVSVRRGGEWRFERVFGVASDCDKRVSKSPEGS